MRRLPALLVASLVGLGAMQPATAGAQARPWEVVLGLRDAAALALAGIDRTSPEIARWRVREEEGRLWPELSFQARGSYENSATAYGSETGSYGAGVDILRFGTDVVLSYNLLQFLESRPRIQGAMTDERAARLRLTQEQSDRLARTSEVYLGLWAEREALEVVDRLRRERMAFLAQQEAKLAEDAIPMIEVVRARAQVVALDRERLGAQRRAATAELELRKLTGLRPDDRLTLALDPGQVDLGLIAERDLPGLLALAAQSSPRVLAAEAAVESARWQVQAARSATYPTLSLSTSAGYGGEKWWGGDDINYSDFRYSVGLWFKFPIFDGGVRKARIAQSELQAESRLREARRAAEDVKGLIEEAYWTYLERRQSRQLLEQELLLAEDELRQATARAEAGVVAPSDPLGAFARQAGVKQELARARADELAKGVRLLLSVGRDPFAAVAPRRDAAPAPATGTPAPAPPSSPLRTGDAAVTVVALREPAPIAEVPRVAEAAPVAEVPRVVEAAPIAEAPSPAEASTPAGASPAGNTASPAAHPATRLTDVRVAPVDGQTTVALVTDGPVARYTSFTLRQPARLVIDLPDVRADGSRPRFEVTANTPELSRVRVGQHADRLRVVLDLERPGADSPVIVPQDDGLAIVLGGR